MPEGSPAAPYHVARLRDIEAVAIAGGLAWRPVRGTLGVRAFGVAGFVAAEAGQDVVEPHAEAADDGRGHEELYVVVRGAARFDLDGDAIDAPAGTLVFVRDPRVHRHAVATEPGTEVLAFGGDPVFQPAGDEWIWRVRPLLGGDLDAARALVDEGMAEAPENPGVWYAQALVAAAEGDVAEARRWLERAVERAPGLLDESRHDEVLAAVTEDPLRDAVLARCAAQREAWLDHPFGEGAAVFKVADRMFALVATTALAARLTVKAEPAFAAALRDSYEAIVPGYHMDKRHWITITLDGSVEADLVEDLIDGSYDLVVAGLPRRVRASLGA
jgi:predicted DNA-binding protein (MmcQ/YjbR family)